MRYILGLILSSLFLGTVSNCLYAYDLSDVTTKISEAIGKGTEERPAYINIDKGEYLLDASVLSEEELYISNTNAINPKKVGISIRGLNNAVIDFHGAELKTRGPVVALVVEDCNNLVIKNFHIDSDSPAMVQGQVVSNDEQGLLLKLADYCYATANENGNVEFVGDGWRGSPWTALAFAGDTKHTLHNVADVAPNYADAKVVAGDLVLFPNWKDARFPVGSVIVLRVDTFNLCGYFINNCSNVRSENILIHYAPAKAVVAQRSEDLVFDNVSICLRESVGELTQNRYFTANADAIHCSCCKGNITVENGIYENMMDDAINVHGIYVKVQKQIDERTVEVKYMRDDSSGFEWAKPGDEVSFLSARTMEAYERSDSGLITSIVESISPVDKDTIGGTDRFTIRFVEPIPQDVILDLNCALENRTQTPTVVYRNNIVRNNRARGALFSTYRSVVIENNIFDWVSGTALLFCGDANGWYESGPCQDVVIRHNKFNNCMTAFYQFCEAPISIYPEIPDFSAQTKYYDGGNENSFIIEENEFNTFDRPILYARSVDGVVFRNNQITRNSDCGPIAADKKTFVFDNANRIKIYDNLFEVGFDFEAEIEKRNVPVDGVRLCK